jgi:hypothetical protein
VWLGRQGFGGAFNLRRKFEVLLRDYSKPVKSRRHRRTGLSQVKTINLSSEVSATSLFHYRRSVLLVFLLADPELLEGPQRRQDGSSDPGPEFALCRVGWQMEPDLGLQQESGESGNSWSKA